MRDVRHPPVGVLGIVRHYSGKAEKYAEAAKRRPMFRAIVGISLRTVTEPLTSQTLTLLRPPRRLTRRPRVALDPANGENP
jgi:hypothetical protein